MRRKGILVLAVLATMTVLLLGCGPARNPVASGTATTATVQPANLVQSSKTRVSPSPQAQSDVPSLVSANNAFAFDLFRAIRSEGENFVCSPYSLSVVLSMTMAGARGDTQTEMADALHFSLSPERVYPAFNALDASLAVSGDLESVCALFGQAGYQYKPAFVNVLAENYGAPLRLVDFADPEAARATINDWASEATKGRIPELLPPEATRAEGMTLFLVGAVYFKATWEHQFSTMRTEDRPFRPLSGDTVQVPTLYQVNDFAYLDTPELQAVELPYAGGHFSMVLLLPAWGTFQDFVAGLDANKLNGILAEMRTGKVGVTLPRFSFVSSPPLQAALESLGMIALLSNPDLSGMVDEGRGVSGVYQTAVISLDESGTEAAAASAVGVAAGIETLDASISFDRPFLCLIRDTTTGSILFLGQVLDPSSGGG